MASDEFHPRHELDSEYVSPVVAEAATDDDWDYEQCDGKFIYVPGEGWQCARAALEPLDRREFREAMDRVAEQLLRLQEAVEKLR